MSCEHCGGDVASKNNAGHFRDICASCARRVADQRTPHRETCEDSDCRVCASYRHLERR